MGELIASVAPMLVLAGLTVGWLAESLSPARGYGLRRDMTIGIAGSIAVAGLLSGVNWLGAGGLVTTFVIGLAGAALAIGAQRTLSGSPLVKA